MSRTLIRNATLVSMDPGIGNPLNTDILVDGERIAAVGRNLAPEDAAVIDGSHSIVTPGLVNAHIHTWEFQLRGIGSDWVGSRDYHANMHRGMATKYTARDVYVGNLLGARAEDPSALVREHVAWALDRHRAARRSARAS